jgi:hypothetical protein
MRLINCADLANLQFEDYSSKKSPRYAILSHTWGVDEDEVTFKEFVAGSGNAKAGYGKIQFCAEQAIRDGLQYIWVDTCCIDKSSSAELSKAINSMFYWYRDSTKCYVYMPDVFKRQRLTSGEVIELAWEMSFRKSRWFTRGWTLQELIAPSSVDFFAEGGEWIGSRATLEQHVNDITRIDIRALRGSPLSGFSIDERSSWSVHRQTKEPEDKAYCLLGLFDVHMPLIYGEGEEKALNRLREEIDKAQKRLLQQQAKSHMEKEDQECIQHLRVTDPRDDKTRIEEIKGGLLEDSYRWIVDNSEFQQWRNDEQSRLLWVKGDPGKGKTMLLCGIINELEKSMAKTNLLSYFFCQATDSRINNARAILRGLIYLIVDQQPSLISHIRKKYDCAGKTLFEDVNAWVALSEILTNILQDPSLNCTFMVIDALDECVSDLPKLLSFIAEQSTVFPRVKWIISSRNLPNIEERLERAGNKLRLCLELNAKSISNAVGIYIQHKVLQLSQQKKYNDKTRDKVLEHLSCNADNTFLWVALVCRNLEDIPRLITIKKLHEFPPGLDSLYDRMLEQIRESGCGELCRHILASMATVYRPITLNELISVTDMLETCLMILNQS